MEIICAKIPAKSVFKIVWGGSTWIRHWVSSVAINTSHLSLVLIVLYYFSSLKGYNSTRDGNITERNPFYYNANNMLACKLCSNSFIASLEQEAKQSDAIIIDLNLIIM